MMRSTGATPWQVLRILGRDLEDLAATAAAPPRRMFRHETRIALPPWIDDALKR